MGSWFSRSSSALGLESCWLGQLSTLSSSWQRHEDYRLSSYLCRPEHLQPLALKKSQCVSNGLTKAIGSNSHLAVQSGIHAIVTTAVLQ